MHSANILCIIAALIHICVGERYILDDDNDLQRFLPYPIGVCIKSRLSQSRYMQFECSNNGDMVTKYTYSDECMTQTASETFTSTDLSLCGSKRFSCRGESHYVTTTYWFSDMCMGKSNRALSIPLAVGCFCDTDYSSIEIYCQEDPFMGTIVTHADSYECEGEGIERDLNSCEKDIIKKGNSTWNQVSDCVMSIPTPEPTPEPTENGQIGRSIMMVIGMSMMSLWFM